jgi:hypothetical protein
VARGNFTNISQEDVEGVQKKAGTKLLFDTAVRIHFEKPILWYGTKRFPFLLQLGAKAQSPPVMLCTTYMDNRIRLAQAAKGGRLVFTRGGKASEPLANDWEAIVAKRPLHGGVVGGTVLTVLAATATLVPATRIPAGLVTVMVTAIVIKTKLTSKKQKE